MIGLARAGDQVFGGRACPIARLPPVPNPPRPQLAGLHTFEKKNKRIALGVSVGEKNLLGSMHFIFACISED